MVGLQWYINGKLETNIRQAAGRYRAKFGVEPNTCYIKEGEESEFGGIKVIVNPTVQPGHMILCHADN